MSAPRPGCRTGAPRRGDGGCARAARRPLAPISPADADRYRGLFENSPISLWEEDFSALKRHLDELRAGGVENLRLYLGEHPEEVQRCASLVRIVDVNEATLDLLECDSKEQVLGPLPTIFRRSSYDTLLEEILALAEGQTVFETDAVNHTMKGRRIDVRIRLALAPGYEECWSKVFLSLTDISDWQRVQAQLQLQSVAMESSADAIFITRRDGRLVWLNGAFTRLSGFSRQEALGKTPRILKSGKHDEAYYREMWQTLLRGEPYRARTVNRHKTGGEYTVEQTITPIVDARGEISHFVAVQQDITERLASEEELVRLAQFDNLTGLPNRYTFHDRLEREAVRAARRNGSVAVLMLDLDHFKDVNDGFGHAVGDQLLVAVADRLRGSLRSLDTVARLGGDEFALLQTEADHAEGSAVLASRLLDLFEEPFEIEGQSIATSVTIGIATARAADLDSRQLIRQADMALYRAKQEGRCTFRFHAAEMDAEVQQRLILSRDLRSAIDDDQLFLVFQPQLDAASRTIVGVEALVRWRHPDKGLVPPGQFIPIAENNGMIVPLGEWVLRQACLGLAELRRAAGRDLLMAVNVSAVQMRAADFADRVLAILAETGTAPTAIELELTESVLMQRTPQLKRTIDRLHRAGVRFSVDDFGTGYSSMMYLREFAVDMLKIDRSFLERVESSASDAAIVSAIVALGNKLGLEVLAEGVERQSQLDFLRQIACDKVQGYFFSKPLPAAEAVTLLAAGRPDGGKPDGPGLRLVANG